MNKLALFVATISIFMNIFMFIQVDGLLDKDQIEILDLRVENNMTILDQSDSSTASNKRIRQPMTGELEFGHTEECVQPDWSPKDETVCAIYTFTQVSTCNHPPTQHQLGAKVDGHCKTEIDKLDPVEKEYVLGRAKAQRMNSTHY